MTTPVIDQRGIYYHFMLLDGQDDDVKILIDDEFGYPTEENCRIVWARYFAEAPSDRSTLVGPTLALWMPS